MKIISKALFVIVFLSSSINLLIGQAIPEESKGRNLFLQGNEMLSDGKYEIADSLYSLALNDYRGSDIYFNRGIARLFMGDTLGFCYDMGIAGNVFFFSKADTLFNRVCCHKVDSIFLDNDMCISDSTNYKYLEELLYLKYEDIKIGKIHNTERNSPTQTFVSGSNPLFQLKYSLPTNVVAMYEYIDSIKYYQILTNPKKLIDRRELGKINERYKLILNDTIDSVLEFRCNNDCSLYITVYLDDTGKATFYKELTLSFSGDIIEQTSFINQILNEYIEALPVFKTPRLFKKDVHSRRFIKLTF